MFGRTLCRVEGASSRLAQGCRFLSSKVSPFCNSGKAGGAKKRGIVMPAAVRVAPIVMQLLFPTAGIKGYSRLKE
jgi:hypothetical protein